MPDITVKSAGNSAVDICPLIHEIHGVPVMFDHDLAELYGVSVKRLNQQVNRNSERFPERFMHQLTAEEFKDLKSQIATSSTSSGTAHLKSHFATSSWGGVRKPPRVFTEQGISMLSAVLRSSTAVEVSIRIMDAFVAMRKALSTVAPALASLATRVETIERRQITDQSRNESRFFARVNSRGIICEQGLFESYARMKGVPSSSGSRRAHVLR